MWPNNFEDISHRKGGGVGTFPALNPLDINGHEFSKKEKFGFFSIKKEIYPIHAFVYLILEFQCGNENDFISLFGY